MSLAYDRKMPPALSAEQALEELSNLPAPAPKARQNYSHVDMADFIIANPGITQNDVAARYGYTPAWVSRILASDAFQEIMAARRKELVDPALVATIDERFRALAIRSVDVLMHKLDAPAVESSVAVRCAELGVRALGLGQPKIVPQDTPAADALERLANRLINLNCKPQESIDGQAQRVEE